jgi:hypothetical protein
MRSATTDFDASTDTHGFLPKLSGTVTEYLNGEGNWSTGTAGREILAADRTYYVRTDGNDSNTGLTDTAGGAFLTIQKAIDVAASLDTSIYNITIQIADGTYAVSGQIICKNILGAGAVIIKGNNSTPENVVIDGGFSKTTPGTAYTVNGLKLIKSSGSAIIAFSVSNGASMSAGYINFGAGFTYHIYCASGGAFIVSTSYTISGGANTHIFCRDASIINIVNSAVITLSGTPVFLTFAYALILGMIVSSGMTFTGSATGKRYNVTNNGVIYTNGGGASYFPGDSAGTAATGGDYS